VALQVVMYILLFVNIPFAGFELLRVVVGFIYLTFIPGYILVRLLKLDLSQFESVVYSAGFSVAMLMVAGLIINQFGPVLGFKFPLSVLPVSLFINTVVLVGAAAAYIKRPKTPQSTAKPAEGFHPATWLLILLPIMSIVGVYFVNATGNSFVLVLMLLFTAGLFGFAAFYDHSKANFYPFAVLMIAIALLFQTSLISGYLLPYGSDSPAEFFVFQTVQQGGHWNPIFLYPADEAFGRYNAMLSITVLPTVYSNVLSLDPTWVFKAVYPLIFALVPVGLYLLWQPYIGKKLSFIAAFLFMAQSTFFTEMTALNRQMIGELFFVLLLLVLLNKKMRPEIKFASFAIFSFGLIFSHYALAEIFLCFIFAAWLVSLVYLKKPSFNLQISTIIFFFAAMFGWYIYTSGAVVFNSFLTFAGYVGGQLGDFFNPSSRGQAVLTGLGLAQSPTFLNTISRVFAYATEFFIVIGVVALLAKKTRFKFDRDFMVFGVIAMAILIALTVVPGLANTLSMTRFYHILLMVLAPFCVIGMWSLCYFILKKEQKAAVSLLIVIVLVPYFLFQTNLAYELAKSDSWSISLSKNRMDPLRLYGEFGYIDTYSVYGVKWFAANAPYVNNTVADNALYTSLTAYGPIYRGYVKELTNETVLYPGECVYLSYITINYASQLPGYTAPQVFNETNLVYSNGGSQVWIKPSA
jgi:uncharacterized membrane protein